jgi:hypothetical protein
MTPAQEAATVLEQIAQRGNGPLTAVQIARETGLSVRDVTAAVQRLRWQGRVRFAALRLNQIDDGRPCAVVAAGLVDPSPTDPAIPADNAVATISPPATADLHRGARTPVPGAFSSREDVLDAPGPVEAASDRSADARVHRALAVDADDQSVCRPFQHVGSRADCVGGGPGVAEGIAGANAAVDYDRAAPEHRLKSGAVTIGWIEQRFANERAAIGHLKSRGFLVTKDRDCAVARYWVTGKLGAMRYDALLAFAATHGWLA